MTSSKKPVGITKMKITRNQIRMLIKEEMETLSSEQQTISTEQEESAALAKDRAEDIETVDSAWAGGPNLVAPVDFESESLTGEKSIHGQQILKIVESLVDDKELAMLIREQWGDRAETGLGIIDFAIAYSGLGNAVQEQVDSILSAWVNGGGPNSENFMEAVYEANPNAVDLALQRLGRLHIDGDEYGEVIDALEAAKRIFERGDEEVESDGRAAGDWE